MTQALKDLIQHVEACGPRVSGELAILYALRAYAESEHVLDSNHCAGDCDSCSARPALEILECLIGGPRSTQ